MIIQAKNIRKSFGTLEVLKGIDLEVRKGEVLAITGASGAGKTTLLQILGTLLSPDAGTLVIDGTTVFDGPSRALRGDALAAFRGSRIGGGRFFRLFFSA